MSETLGPLPLFQYALPHDRQPNVSYCLAWVKSCSLLLCEKMQEEDAPVGRV